MKERKPASRHSVSALFFPPSEMAARRIPQTASVSSSDQSVPSRGQCNTHAAPSRSGNIGALGARFYSANVANAPDVPNDRQPVEKPFEGFARRARCYIMRCKIAASTHVRAHLPSLCAVLESERERERAAAPANKTSRVQKRALLRFDASSKCIFAINSGHARPVHYKQCIVTPPHRTAP